MSLLISSSTNGVPESSWRVLLLMYHGALNTFLGKSDVWLTVHRNSVWIRKTN